ncbi:hypothetical protein FACS1894164_14890 [Spirochaetia bacterium]|nr:hypothetical protein FACS1894164_14890 [Spirochaetia bacterium]
MKIYYALLLCIVLFASCELPEKGTVTIQFGTGATGGQSVGGAPASLPEFSKVQVWIAGNGFNIEESVDDLDSSRKFIVEVPDSSLITGITVKATVNHDPTDDPFPYIKSLKGTGVKQVNGSYLVSLELGETAVIFPGTGSLLSSVDFPNISSELGVNITGINTGGFSMGGVDFDRYGRLLTITDDYTLTLAQSPTLKASVSRSGSILGSAYCDGKAYLIEKGGTDLNLVQLSLQSSVTDSTLNITTSAGLPAVSGEPYVPVAVYKDGSGTYAFAAESSTSNLVKFDADTGNQVPGTSFALPVLDLRIIRNRLYILSSNNIGSLELSATDGSGLKKLETSFTGGTFQRIAGWDDDSIYVIVEDNATSDKIVRILTDAEGNVSLDPDGQDLLSGKVDWQ